MSRRSIVVPAIAVAGADGMWLVPVYVAVAWIHEKSRISEDTGAFVSIRTTSYKWNYGTIISKPDVNGGKGIWDERTEACTPRWNRPSSVDAASIRQDAIGFELPPPSYDHENLDGRIRGSRESCLLTALHSSYLKSRFGLEHVKCRSLMNNSLRSLMKSRLAVAGRACSRAIMKPWTS
ncbi:hypothetical protein BJX68DRAFT_33321 [Aspergillus pseudodeflectus]|uniref:Secreted protein n=1 Tax=Aspergillus pseudodeflectus TaxID=176178 RepID=A0ABR4KR24_9EURO